MGKKIRIATTLVSVAVAVATIQRRKEILNARPHTLDNVENILILGSGGILGLAWEAATLMRLEKEGVWAPENDHLRIGTSAGSLIAVSLGAGVSPKEMLDVIAGGTVVHNGREFTMPDMGDGTTFSGEKSDKWYIMKSFSKLRMPYMGLFFSSLVPEGKRSLRDFEDFVDAVTSEEWPATPTWVATTERSNGKRYIFNQNSPVSPGFAVASSCAVPAMYKPLSHGRMSFIDGGVISGLHIDLALNSGVKKVIVLAPISGFVLPRVTDTWMVALRKANRNFQEVALLKAQIKAKIMGVELLVIRPRVAERKILNRSRLTDFSMLDNLIKTTLGDDGSLH